MELCQHRRVAENLDHGGGGQTHLGEGEGTVLIEDGDDDGRDIKMMISTIMLG